MFKTLIAAAALLATPLPALAGPTPGALTLHIANVTQHQGRVMIAIFDEAGWNGGKPVRVANADAAPADVAAVIAGLAPGRYAVKLYQDVNGDGQMGTNPFGFPTEPFGFSHDASGMGGAPAWADASFEVTASGAEQTITLR